MSDALREWAINYFNYRKACLDEPFEVSDEGVLKLSYEDHELEIVCMEKLKLPEKSKPKIFVTLDTKDNLEFLLGNWKAFCIHNLKIYFVNLKRHNQKWVVSPAIHDRICEKSNLKKSLKSMASAASSH